MILDGLTEDQQQVLLGSMFGDGGCTMPKDGKVAYFEESHKASDSDYLAWKLSVLYASNLFKSPVVLPRNANKPEEGVYIRSRCDRGITDLYNAFYVDGRKIVTPYLLSLLLPLGIAVWYMDDGNLSKEGHITLSTESYTYEENVSVRDWILSTFHARFKIYPKVNRHGPPYYRLVTSDKVNASIFLNVVKPYCAKGMEKKFTPIRFSQLRSLKPYYRLQE